MRAVARLGWRVAAVVAFGATAALAVTLTRGAPMHAALASARSHDAAPRCAASGLRISLGAVPAAATGVRQGLTSYALDFTNVSDRSASSAVTPRWRRTWRAARRWATRRPRIPR
jgi:hypothetical protein